METEKRGGPMLIIAEDDDDDFLLTVAAMEEAGLSAEIIRTKDGEELLDFLHRRGRHKSRDPLPDAVLVLLDLNMPRKDGREALRDIKSDPSLRRLPVVVLTTSRAEEDVVRAYELGVNSFIRKPASFQQFVECVKALRHYWFETVQLPSGGAL